MNAVIELLGTDAVANEPEAAGLRVPESHREHAAKFLQALDAPCSKGLQDHLGIGVIGFPASMPQVFQFAPDLGVVIDLAVEDDVQRAILVAHGLGSGVGEVDDGKAAMRQT